MERSKAVFHTLDENNNIITIDGFSYLEIVRGNVAGYSIIHKFGSGNVGTSLIPITRSGFYRTPQAVTGLELVSDNVADAQNGVGAREITYYGIDINNEEVTNTLLTHATVGTTAVALPDDLKRLYRWHVSSSGTYATSLAGSHAGSLTIQETGGGDVWDTIPATPFPASQSQIGSYTIPSGFTGYLIGKLIYTDTSKTADIFMFQRDNIDDIVAPYSGIMRISEREIGVQGGFDHHFSAPKFMGTGPCDIGFMGKVASGTADISVEFELLLIADSVL